MKSLPVLLVSASLTLLAVVPTASAETLTTTFTGDTTGDEGVMFDVIALKNIEITGIRTGLEPALSANVEIFTRPGTWVGFDASNVGWTLSGSAAVTAPSLNAPSTVVPLAGPLPINAGERFGIYIVRDAGAGDNIDLSTGDGVGTVEAFDNALVIFEGSDITNLFGGVSSPDRIPNITIEYEFQAGTAPTVRALSPRNLRTTDPRVALFALSSDDGKVSEVRVRTRVPRPSGGVRVLSRTLTPDTNGLVRVGVRALSRPTPVIFVAVDNKGQLSTPSRVIVRRTGL